MIANKKTFSVGLIMLVGFFVALFIIFLPIFNGHNGLDYLDNLYNTISKDSAYYIPKCRQESAPFKGQQVEVNLTLPSEKVAQQATAVLTAAGAQAAGTGKALKVTGDLGQILTAVLDDSDFMFKNDGQKVKDKYQLDEKVAMHAWWQALKSMEKDLTRQKKFPESKTVLSVEQKAVETAYNFYKIEPQSIGDKWGVVAFSLLFYVVYTVWYGYAIMFMAEGWGMRLEH